MAAPFTAHRYYGLVLGLLDGSDAVTAIVLVNRPFTLPLLLQGPGGVAVDLGTLRGVERQAGSKLR